MSDAVVTLRHAAEWQPPRPAAERNYPMSCWWVAAPATRWARTCSGGGLCDTPVLLYRRGDEMQALEP